MKKYAYLLFALFFAFSACQEDVVEETSDADISKVEPITFTFVYKGKEYQEVRSSATDQMQNKIIEDVLSTDNHSIYKDPERENTIYLFDSSEEAKSFFNISISSKNTRVDCSAGENRAQITFYRDKNYEHPYSFEPWSYNPDFYDNNPREYWSFYRIDNYSSTFNIPCSRSVSDMGSFDNKASSIKLDYFWGGSVEAGYRKVVLFIYTEKNFLGRSEVLTRDGYRGFVGTPNLSNAYFYDFFGIKYGPTWNDKISSFDISFRD